MPLASEIMDQAAALLNDSGKTIFTYSVQLPFLQSAFRRLQQVFHLNGIPVLQEDSAVIQVPAGTGVINAPSNLAGVKKLFERGAGSSEEWTEVQQADLVPVTTQEYDRIIIWHWSEELIKVNPPKTNREIRLIYYKEMDPIIGQNSNIPVRYATEYLSYKTAALCAKFIGENPTRAADLDLEAERVLQLLLGIEIKAQQYRPVRPKGYR